MINISQVLKQVSDEARESELEDSHAFISFAMSSSPESIQQGLRGFATRHLTSNQR